MLFVFVLCSQQTECFIFVLQVVFHIKGGSGHFAVKGSSSAIAKVNYKSKADIVVSLLTLSSLPRSDN